MSKQNIRDMAGNKSRVFKCYLTRTIKRVIIGAVLSIFMGFILFHFYPQPTRVQFRELAQAEADFIYSDVDELVVDLYVANHYNKAMDARTRLLWVLTVLIGVFYVGVMTLRQAVKDGEKWRRAEGDLYRNYGVDAVIKVYDSGGYGILFRTDNEKELRELVDKLNGGPENNK